MADESKSSAAKVADILDLLREILARLPVKSLIRSECVSKRWYSLISDSKFRYNHTLRLQNPDISALYFYHDPPHEYDVTSFASKRTPPLNNHAVSFTGSAMPPSLSFAGSHIAVVTHCNGLLLCYNDTGSYLVCNPTTKEFSKFPIPQDIGCVGFGEMFKPSSWPYDPSTSIAYCQHQASLAYDPSKSPLVFQVFLVIATHFGNSHILAYSSDTASWKSIVVDTSAASWISSPGVFFKGSIYWAIRSHNGYGIIVQYDIGSEKLSSSKPFVNLRDNDIQYFGECRGSLVVVLPKCKKNYYFLCIFEMVEGDGMQWSFNFKCSYKLTPTLELPTSEQASVMCVLKGDDGGFELVLGIPGKIVLYSPKRKNELKVLSHTPSLKIGSLPVKNYAYVYPFVGTLATV